jgi:hypothetical protein
LSSIFSAGQQNEYLGLIWVEESHFGFQIFRFLLIRSLGGPWLDLKQPKSNTAYHFHHLWIVFAEGFDVKPCISSVLFMYAFFKLKAQIGLQGLTNEDNSNLLSISQNVHALFMQRVLFRWLVFCSIILLCFADKLMDFVAQKTELKQYIRIGGVQSSHKIGTHSSNLAPSQSQLRITMVFVCSSPSQARHTPHSLCGGALGPSSSIQPA